MLRLRAWALLGIALTFYLIGEPIFVAVGDVLNLPFTWEIIVIGLFIGLLPRREATMLYGVGVCVSLVEMAVNYPKLMAEIFAMAQGAGLVGPFIPVIDAGVSGFNIPIGVIVILLLAVGFIMVKYREKLWPFIKMQLIIYAITFGSIILPSLFAILTVPRNLAGLSYDEVLYLAAGWVTTSSIVFSVWLIITGPFIVCLFLRFLGLYKRIPGHVAS